MSHGEFTRTIIPALNAAMPRPTPLGWDEEAVHAAESDARPASPPVPSDPDIREGLLGLERLIVTLHCQARLDFYDIAGLIDLSHQRVRHVCERGLRRLGRFQRRRAAPRCVYPSGGHPSLACIGGNAPGAGEAPARSSPRRKFSEAGRIC